MLIFAARSTLSSRKTRGVPGPPPPPPPPVKILRFRFSKSQITGESVGDFDNWGDLVFRGQWSFMGNREYRRNSYRLHFYLPESYWGSKVGLRRRPMCGSSMVSRLKWENEIWFPVVDRSGAVIFILSRHIQLAKALLPKIAGGLKGREFRSPLVGFARGLRFSMMVFCLVWNSLSSRLTSRLTEMRFSVMSRRTFIYFAVAEL